jgi:hypothetical protein
VPGEGVTRGGVAAAGGAAGADVGGVSGGIAAGGVASAGGGTAGGAVSLGGVSAGVVAVVPAAATLGGTLASSGETRRSKVAPQRQVSVSRYPPSLCVVTFGAIPPHPVCCCVKRATSEKSAT